jgi:pilus assembly protein Flp/PilA
MQAIHQRFFRDDRGATMIEYVIMVGIVALIAYGGFQMFGQKVKSQIETQGNSVGAVNGALGPP